MKFSPQKESEKLFNEGVEFYEQERIPEAEAKFIEALELNPVSEEIMYNLALVYFEQKKYELTWALVNQIRELDCSELIDELEKTGFEEKYEIPDSIPDSCELCDYFKAGSMIKDEGGFCSFYTHKVNSGNQCLALRLADEGKVSLEDVKKNRNKKILQSIEKYQDGLNDERLPEMLDCLKCSVQNHLNETDRVAKSFICTKCKTINDIGKQMKELEHQLQTAFEMELFQMVIFEQDYKPEFSLAAKREINRRGLDIAKNDEFLNLLAEFLLNQSIRA